MIIEDEVGGKVFLIFIRGEEENCVLIFFDDGKVNVIMEFVNLEKDNI